MLLCTKLSLSLVVVLLIVCVNSQSYKEDTKQECWNRQCQENNNNNNNQGKQIQFVKQFASKLSTTTTTTTKDVLSQWVRYVDMNPDWIGTYVQTNWMEVLHTRIQSLAPNAIWNVYRTKPSSHDRTILLMDTTTTREEAFRLHRHRGLVSIYSHTFGTTVLTSIQRWISYATLSEEALIRISQYAPLIEVGAGTAYWSAILQHRGIDIQPYDLYNTTEENEFIEAIYTNVTQASCTDLFPNEPSSPHYNNYNYKRSLLLIWPNNPDYIDNIQYSYGSHDNTIIAWDYTCLEAYIRAGGQTVIFVGEREENIKLMKHALQNNIKDSGMCATRQFQSMLKQYFTLQEQITIPTWWNVDDLTIWKRRRSS